MYPFGWVSAQETEDNGENRRRGKAIGRMVAQVAARLRTERALARAVVASEEALGPKF